MDLAAFESLGWAVIDHDREILRWAEAARGLAISVANDQALKHAWLRHGKTWFAGVNALPNGPDGAVGDISFPKGLVSVLKGRFPFDVWDKAQVSVTYPGYPQKDEGETQAAAQFRRARDAAHVDGVLPVGPDKSRFLKEAHAFVIGIPLTVADVRASPMVVWDRSHLVMKHTFLEALKSVRPENWENTDLTESYKTGRKTCFDTCERRIVHVPVGSAYIIHRAALHGVAPWGENAKADKAGRVIAYFRPDLTGGVTAWFGP